MADLARGIDRMYKENGGKLNGIVLDLRNNPGGLLHASIGVSAAFLDSKALVVSSNGRLPDTKHEYFATPEEYAFRAREDQLRGLPAALKKAYADGKTPILSIETTPNGEFSIASLRPTTYDIRVEEAGFNSAVVSGVVESGCRGKSRRGVDHRRRRAQPGPCGRGRGPPGRSGLVAADRHPDHHRRADSICRVHERHWPRFRERGRPQLESFGVSGRRAEQRHKARSAARRDVSPDRRACLKLYQLRDHANICADAI